MMEKNTHVGVFITLLVFGQVDHRSTDDLSRLQPTLIVRGFFFSFCHHSFHPTAIICSRLLLLVELRAIALFLLKQMVFVHNILSGSTKK